MGRRIRKQVGGGVTWFQYADNGLVAEFDAFGRLQRAYGWQPQGFWGGEPVFHADILTTMVSTHWASHHYHNDHLGTPQRLSDENGGLSWSAKAEAFGNTLTKETNGVDNPLGFPGQYADQESGFRYNFFRNYDSRTGRYLTVDPIGLRGGVNIYAYAIMSPTLLIDPTGKQPCCSNPTDEECCANPGEGGYGEAFGLLVCCNGRKVPCVRPELPPEITPFRRCLQLHENAHHDRDEGENCDPCGVYPVRSTNPWSNRECYAYQEELDCLNGERGGCYKLKNPARQICLNNIASRVGFIKRQAKSRGPCSFSS